jgi:hypothetical protein
MGMAFRLPLVLVLAGALASLGASHRSTNFVVEAANPQVAQQVAQYAEHYRKEKALQWLGQEMPAWGQPCPLRVTVTMSGAGGATTFQFDNGAIMTQHMHIEGSLDRLLNSVLPHEVTHTVFAYHFRCPVPRWADEGGAVLSEDEPERNRHDMLCRQILNTPGRAIPLRRLFGLRDYPGDVMALYAEGFAVANFLVGRSNRQTFLAFVAAGMRQGWDRAAQSYYGFGSVEEMEQAWLNHLRDARRPPAQLARNTAGPATHAEADPSSRVVVRQTAPPVQPLQEAPPAPVVRSQSPEPAGRFEAPPHLQGHWQPAPRVGATPPPAVHLGPPQFGTPSHRPPGAP